MDKVYKFKGVVFLLILAIFIFIYFLFLQDKIEIRSITVFLFAFVISTAYMLFVDRKVYFKLLYFIFGIGFAILLAIFILPPPSIMESVDNARNNEVVPIFLSVYFLFLLLLYSAWLHLHYEFKNNLLKTKFILLAFSVLTFGYLELIIFSGKIGICPNVDHGLSCFVDFTYLINPLIPISLLFIFVFIMIFFVSNYVLKKWINFLICWLVIETFLIISFPYDYGGWLSFGPTKYLVSLWMSSLFLIISLILLGVWQLKEKKLSK